MNAHPHSGKSRRSGAAIWLIDGPLGHLEIPYRSGWFQTRFGVRTVHFVSVSDALQSLPKDAPQAIMVGYVDKYEALKLFQYSGRTSTPTLIIGNEDYWQKQELPESVHIATGTTLDAVTDFVQTIMGSP